MIEQTSIRKKPSRAINATILTLLFAVTFWGITLNLMNYAQSNASQTHTGREVTARGIFAGSDEPWAYASNVGVVTLEVKAKMNQKTSLAEVEAPRYNLTDEEKHMLCFVAIKEDHTSVESMQAVMQVVMNRANSDKFPDTVYDVLYQKKPVQFGCMKNYKSGWFPVAEHEDVYRALENLLYEDDIFGGECALFFSASHVKPERIAKGLYEVAEIGGSKFWGQE